MRRIEPVGVNQRAVCAAAFVIGPNPSFRTPLPKRPCVSPRDERCRTTTSGNHAEAAKFAIRGIVHDRLLRPEHDESPLKIISALALWHTEDGQAHFAFVDGVDQRSDKNPSPFDRNKPISTISHSFGSLCQSPLDSNCGLTFRNRSPLPRSLGHKILSNILGQSQPEQ